MHPVLDAIVAILLILGAAFALVGSYGLAKLGDFAKRLHGPTKATTLGVGSVLAASAVFFTPIARIERDICSVRPPRRPRS